MAERALLGGRGKFHASWKPEGLKTVATHQRKILEIGNGPQAFDIAAADQDNRVLHPEAFQDTPGFRRKAGMIRIAVEIGQGAVVIQ